MSNEPVDVSRPTADARGEAERWATEDPTYAENAATLAELGELLDAGENDRGYEMECRQLATRSIALERAMQHEFEAKRALWHARNTRPMGVEFSA